MITFKILSPQAFLSASISLVTASKSPCFTSPRLITISISEAPSSMACFVSATFTSVVSYPKGKPITVHMLSSGYASWADATKSGGIQTDAVLYLIPSSQTSLISSHVAVGRNNV